MKELRMQIPDWKLRRMMKVKVESLPDEAHLKSLTISAVEVDGITATVFQDVKLRANQKEIERIVIRGNTKKKRQSQDEFTFHVPSRMVTALDDAKESESGSKGASSSGLVAELSFFGNYSEPNLCVPLSPCRDTVYRLGLDIGTKQWTVESMNENEVAVQQRIR